MAYSFVSAIGREKGLELGWVPVDPMTKTIQELVNKYQNLLIKFTNPFLTDPIIFDLPNNRHLFNNFTVTLQAWITANSGTALPSSGKEFSTRRIYAEYGDAYRHNYQFRRVHPSAHPDMEVNDILRTDVLMTRPGSDYDLLSKRALVSVNGYVHRTDISGYGIYIRDARKTVERSKDNLIGLLTFTNIADMTILPIDDNMIFKPGVDHRLYDGAYINLGQTTVNKSVMICIGGYLHAGHDAYSVTGDGIVKIDFTHIPLLQRIYESRNHLDLSALDHHYLTGLDDGLPMNAFHSDEFIRDYLKLSQSFIVILNSPGLVSEKSSIAYSKFPGLCVSFEDPRHWMVNRFGRTLNYHHRREMDRWSVTTQLDYDTAELAQSTMWSQDYAVTQGWDPNRDVRMSAARWNKLYVEQLTITP